MTTQNTRPWALVTGASGGLGQAFVDHLSSHGANVAITGRNPERLAETAARAEQRGAEVLSVLGDLSQTDERARLLAELDERGVEVATLVNNAGFGMVGELAEMDEARLAEMLQLNVVALTHLTRALLPGMLQRGQGSIVNVASTAAFQPLASMAAYAASKSYVLSFSQALGHETKGTGVRVLALCPGPTETGFFTAAGDSRLLAQGRRTPEQCVRTAFAALAAGKPVVVDGLLNRLGAIAGPRVPGRLAVEIGARVVGH